MPTLPQLNAEDAAQDAVLHQTRIRLTIAEYQHWCRMKGIPWHVADSKGPASAPTR
jgi:hypothetical protein